jgi:penicillin-binding protein 2
MRKLLLPLFNYCCSIIASDKDILFASYKRHFKLKSDNAIKIKYDYPERVIYMTETEELLVSNQASYDIMVIPRELKNRHFRVLQLLNITKEDYIKTAKAKVYSPRLPSVFFTSIKQK